MQAANQARATAASVSDALTDLQSLLVGLCASEPEQACLNLAELAQQLSAIAHTAETGGARGLPNVTLRLVERLLPMQQQTVPALEIAGALEEWVQLAFAYLDDPVNPDTSQPLIEFLDAPLWSEKLSQGQIAILNRLFEIDARPPLAPARPAAPPALVPAALDDKEVAKLLDVTETVPAVSEATVKDWEATQLAELPRELLSQLAAAAQLHEGPIHADPIHADRIHEDEIHEEGATDATSNEPTVQIATLVLADLRFDTAPTAATPFEDFDPAALPAVGDPNLGWDTEVPSPALDEPAPIPSLPGQYEGEAAIAVWSEQPADEITADADFAALASAIDVESFDAVQAGTLQPGTAKGDWGWDADVLADYSGEVPLPVAGAPDSLDADATADFDADCDADFAIDSSAELAVPEMAIGVLESHEVIVEGFEVEAIEALPLVADAITVWTETASQDEHLELASTTTEDPASAYPGLPAGVAELIAMIHQELTGCMQSMSTSLESAATAAFTGEPVSLEDYRWQVERLSSAAQSIGLHGLHEFMARVLEASCLIESALQSEVPQQCEVLDRWPPLVDQYLRPLANAEACHALIEYITSQELAMPLDADAAMTLAGKLARPEIEGPPASMLEARARQACAADVSLAVPEDIHPELLDSLLHELPPQTQEFSGALQRIAAGTGAAEDIRVAQRIAHTLKGSANTVGIRGIAALAHHLEDIFLALQERGALPPPALARTLVDAADCLEAMSEALLGVGPAPAQALQVLQEVLDWANHIDAHGIEAPTPQMSEAPVPPEMSVMSAAAVAPATTEPSATADVAPAESLAAAQADAHASGPTLRVASTQVDDLLRLSGESRIVGGQLSEGVRRLESQLQAVRRQNQLFQQLVSELEQLVDIRGITMPSMRRQESHGFDALEMDQYSELHTVSRRLTEAATDAREWSSAAQTELRTLADLLLSQARHSGESQESILKMRMVPASTIVGRLQRGVRQTSRLLDKDVALHIKGEATLVDSDSLNQLVDPLMHLMRNAIDHGIEAAADRSARGKASQGNLRIEFGREGNQIFVRCADDGRGLDYKAIRATAITRGLINGETQLSDTQLARLILEPGFSTRNEVTQVSGRGIGLDIVHSRVLELKGNFDLQSETGHGCRFTIRLPATLLSAHALLVRHGEHTVAIASRGVRQILDSRSCKVAMLGTRLTLQVGREVYDAHALQSLLGQPLPENQPLPPQPALLVEVAADRICAVLVPSVLDTVDLVVKPLGAYVPRAVGVIGATILGNGSVAPVIDLPDLLRAGARAVNRKVGPRVLPGPSSNKLQQPTVLVVDDSLSVRRSMQQLLSDSGYQVRLARDGLEAVAMIEANKPDLLLVDLEMPRMNGMELTAHVRNRSETRALPVIMITSRSTEKHRKQAETAGVSHYMTKPFTDEVLLAQMDSLLKRSA
jgi:chemosensory pili system protein ChpA (sensor histidine kinase/response regulator)